MKAGIGTMLHYLSGNHAPLSWMVGKTIAAIDGLTEGSESVRFTMSDGSFFLMFHQEDCCESVSVADFEDDGIAGGTVVVAEVKTNEDEDKPAEWAESWTWTFIEIRTNKGRLSMRWLGESNGYYGETPCFTSTEAS